MITLGTPGRGLNRQAAYNAKAVALDTRCWFDVELNESGQVVASSVVDCVLSGTPAYEDWLRGHLAFVVILEGKDAA